MEKIKPIKKDRQYLGAVWLLPLILVGILASGVVAVTYFNNKEEAQKAKYAFQSLIEKDKFFLDEEKTIGASADYDVYMTLKTEEDEYILAELVEAELKEDNFVGTATIQLPSGEYAYGDYDSFVQSIALKDGTQKDAQIIDKAVAVVKLIDGTFVPVKIVNGKVRAGKLEGIFSGRTFDAGYKFAGLVENRKIASGYVVASPSSVSASSRILAYLATVESRLTYDTSSYLSGVLAFHEEIGEEEPTTPTEAEKALDALEDPRNIISFEGRILVPNYEAGTYQLVGDDAEGASITTLKNIVEESLAGAQELVSPEVGTFFLTDDIIESRHIKNLTITNADIASETIDGSRIRDGSLKSSDIEDQAINTAKIKDDDITASDLANTLSFGEVDFIDLAAVTHNDTGLHGLRLPNVSSATPSSPASGEGFLAYDTSGNQVLVYNGSYWTQISGSISLYTSSGETTTTSSSSGMELINTDELSLIRGCASGELLKWDETAKEWECGTDIGGGGGGISTIQHNDATVVSGATSIDFLGSDFNVVTDGASEGDISIDYTSSNIVRSNQSETISNGWTFNGSITANDASADTILIGQSGATDDTVTIAGNVSITDDDWGISVLGVGTNLTATDLSCTDCLDADQISDIYLLNTG